MSNELFIDVSEEQQQIVAGGGFFDDVYTDFDLDKAELIVNLGSGEEGSFADQEFRVKKVKTKARKTLSYDNYYPSYDGGGEEY